MSLITSLYRQLPIFRGKIRLGSFFFRKYLHNPQPVSFKGKYNLQYFLPNTIDSIGRDLFLTGVYEHDTFILIKSLLSKDAVFFDVGANIGAITLPVSKLTEAHIHAFEPSDFIFNYLNKNVKDNNLNCILNKQAVYSVNDIEVDFYGSQSVHGWSTMLATDTFIKCKVHTITLDNYCFEKNIEKIHVLKLDVQGLEYEVLKGARKLLEKRAIPDIIFEFEHWAEKNAGLEPGTSQQFLLNMGYELFTLQNEKLICKWTTGTHMIWARLKIYP